MSLNKACLLGNVGKDPEIRYTQGGDPVASFSIATSERWTGRDGEKQERTEWHNITVFGKLAEVVQKYVTKGKQLYVEGSIRTEEYKDRDGNARRSTKIKLSGPQAKLVLLGGGSNGGSRRESGPDDFQVSDDDVPF